MAVNGVSEAQAKAFGQQFMDLANQYRGQPVKSVQEGQARFSTLPEELQAFIQDAFENTQVTRLPEDTLKGRILNSITDGVLNGMRQMIGLSALA